MRRIQIILGLAMVILAMVAGWQIGAAEIANMNLQEDMRDMASQAGTHVGVVAPSTDEETARTVVRKASEHGIELSPDQVTVRSATSGEMSTWYLAADYTAPIHLGIVTLRLHFTPSSAK